MKKLKLTINSFYCDYHNQVVHLPRELTFKVTKARKGYSSIKGSIMAVSKSFPHICYDYKDKTGTYIDIKTSIEREICCLSNPLNAQEDMNTQPLSKDHVRWQNILKDIKITNLT